MGKNKHYPIDSFAVANAGGDDPVEYHLEYESEWFTVDHDSGFVMDVFEVTTSDAGWPVGVYYDSIKIVAPKAINSPYYMIIKINKSAGVAPPRILVESSNIVIPTQELNGPFLGYLETIDNEYGGCMPWTTTEAVPWLTLEPSSGNVSGYTRLIAESTPSFLFGQYVDSFFISSPGASNTPRRIQVTLKVWKYFGDVNYDKRVNIVDVVYLVAFLFQGGAVPQPEYRVGDVTCDDTVNIVDLTQLVAYLYQNGDALCGNPDK
jgi:hypothetical protein